MQEVLTLILGGGRGTRLYPLTKHRSEPAVPLAGKYRLIDIPVSNCLNSGLRRVYVLTQFLSVSLHRHLAATFKFSPFSRAFVEVLPAQQTNETADWYQGTADAVRQNLRYVLDDPCEHVLVLSGDQVYRMDFTRLIAHHEATGADATLAVHPVGPERARHLGVVQAVEEGRLVRLVEKPQDPQELAGLRTPGDWLRRRGCDLAGREYLGNMGIYLFRREALLRLLAARPDAHDLVREVLAPALESAQVGAFLFDGYWEDLGTVKSYHEAHLALTGPAPPFDFESPEGVIYTRMRNLPASRVRDARVDRCLIADGCVVGPGADLERSVLGVRSRVGPGARLRETVLIGADRFETAEERRGNRQRGVPDLGVGEGSVIERAIVDKDCRIGRGVRIVNSRGLENADAEHHVIRDGIVVIPNGTTLPDGTVI
jgi:glucose-1-phosphate adenylyltransferase